jgi:hypothetical protein
MDDLKARIKGVVPFLGSGMSVPYGYLPWGRFLEHLLNVASEMPWVLGDKTEEIEKVKNCLKDSRFLGAADGLDRIVPNFDDTVCASIDSVARDHTITPDNSGVLGEFLHLFPSKTYLTTNYDRVVENILRLKFGEMLRTVVPGDGHRPDVGLSMFDEPLYRNPVLYYLHGRYDVQESIILSESSYNKYYGFSSDGGQIDMRYSLTKTLFNLYNDRYVFLFLGCGMNVSEDRLLKLFRRVNSLMKLHSFNYALLDKKDIANLNTKEHELLGLKVRPIWFSTDDMSHEDAERELFEYILGKERVALDGHITDKKLEEEMRSSELGRMWFAQNTVADGSIAGVAQEFFESSGQENSEKPRVLRFCYPMAKDRLRLYELFLVEDADGFFYVSDGGSTYADLDKIFELKEPDVTKNLGAIIRQFGCRVNGNINALNIPCTKDDFLVKSGFLVQAISFMLNMKIFYV